MLIRRRSTWALLFLFAIARIASAQDVISISGVVTTRADGLSLPGAVVSVDGATTTATTDLTGRYVLTVPRTVARGGRIRVTVHAPALQPQTVDVSADSPSIAVDVALTLGFVEQVTVGSRAIGADGEKAVPVDVISHDEIVSTGYTETAQVIEALTPSFNFPRPTIT